MMHRMLIVDDEEIITDSLYEVTRKLLPDELDVCKAYSAREALAWLSRTRIDIVLTDIRMPGMNGLELSEQIRQYWPRCRIIFLTGHSEFDYAYQAMKVPNIRYLLKTEGYNKVLDTVREVLEEIRHSERMDQLINQSRDRAGQLELMWQTDYFRHLIQDSPDKDLAQLEDDFRQLNICLDARSPVVLALGHIQYPDGLSYMERRERLNGVRLVWNSYLTERPISIVIEDKYGDLVWFIQPDKAEGRFVPHLIRYLEGTMELIQQSVMESSGLVLTFAINGEPCTWTEASLQYERLHLLMHLRFGGGMPAIIKAGQEESEDLQSREEYRMKQKLDILAAHLDAGREEDFIAGFDEVMMTVVCMDTTNPPLVMETYYGIALSLLGHINRFGLHGMIGDYGKLMRFDEHGSLSEAFVYLYQIARRIFTHNRLNEKDRAAKIIDRLCQYILTHLNEDLSLVRLAELHYFNPSYLSRLFKQEKGMNLSDYIEQCRIARAKELLQDRDLKVREVAAAVGYDAAHSFTRFFKKTTGVSPQEYRDQLIKGG